MRTSEIQEKMIAQMGITIDDYYADPSLAVARDIFRSITRCGPSDEEVEVFLHAQKPFCNPESDKAYWEEKYKAVEQKKQASAEQLKLLSDDLAVLNTKEANARSEWMQTYEIYNKVTAHRNKLDAELKALTAQETHEPAVKATLETDLEAAKQAFSDANEDYNQKYVVYNSFGKTIKECKAKIKELKNAPNALHGEIYTIKDRINRLSSNSEEYYKKDDDALDFLFAVLLGIRLKTKDYNNTFPSLPIPLTPAEKMAIVAKHMKRNNLTPKDWRQQLHRVCSMPLKRFMGSISNPTEERMTFFEMKKNSLSATDLSAFLALKIAALNHEFILTGAGAIVLALPGGLAASVTIREKGKIIAKQQKSTVETYVNLLKSKNQYAYHLMYHYDGGPAEGVGIETPGAYYILSETYVFEITFMAAPMLLGFDIMAKTAQNISIVARLDEEQIKAEEQLLQHGDWEAED